MHTWNREIGRGEVSTSVIGVGHRCSGVYTHNKSGNNPNKKNWNNAATTNPNTAPIGNPYTGMNTKLANSVITPAPTEKYHFSICIYTYLFFFGDMYHKERSCEYEH